MDDKVLDRIYAALSALSSKAQIQDRNSVVLCGGDQPTEAARYLTLMVFEVEPEMDLVRDLVSYLRRYLSTHTLQYEWGELVSSSDGLLLEVNRSVDESTWGLAEEAEIE